MKRRLTLLTLLMLGLSGCSLAPPYQPPAINTAQQYKEAGQWIPARSSTPAGDWWTAFGDARLDALETLAAQANQNIAAAAARVDEARAIARASDATLYPDVTAYAQHTDNRMSQGRPLFPSTVPRNWRDNQLGVDLGYELDVWGRLRNAARAAGALAIASEDDLAAATLSSQAELAMDYFNLRGVDTQLALIDQLIANWHDNLDLTQQMFDRGNANQTDLAQAAFALQNQITQQAELRLQRGQLEHAIALLCGQPPSGFSIAPGDPAFDIRVARPDPGLPSTLLQRRPDIAAAERRMAAANATIGVARAAFFPVFSLNASAGFESTTLNNLLTAPNRFWSVGPGAAMVLFDGGQLAALSDQAQAAWRESVANYRNSVLSAWRDVEDSLSSLHELDDESQTALGAQHAAQQALEQMQYRYRAGVVSELDVLTATRQATQAKLTATAIHMRQVTADIVLVKALGGGWQSRTLAAFQGNSTP